MSILPEESKDILGVEYNLVNLLSCEGRMESWNSLVNWFCLYCVIMESPMLHSSCCHLGFKINT